MVLNGHILMTKIGNMKHSTEALTRDSVRPFVRYYLEQELHSVLFLTWEVKPGVDHPENDRVVEEFLDVLEAMGIVTS